MSEVRAFPRILRGCGKVRAILGILSRIGSGGETTLEASMI